MIGRDTVKLLRLKQSYHINNPQSTAELEERHNVYFFLSSMPRSAWNPPAIEARSYTTLDYYSA
jgi:hypothetical protein